MGVFIGMLMRALAWSAIPIAIQVLASIGIGYAVYEGVGALFDNVFVAIKDNLAGLSVQLLTALRLLKVDLCLNVIFAAIAARLTFAGLSAAGSFTRTRWGKPPAPSV